MPSSFLSHFIRVGLRLFLHVVFFGARRFNQQCVPNRRGQVSHRLMRLESGLEHDFVETPLFDLAFPLGLGHYCRRAACLSFPLGSTGGSSELPSALLFLSDFTALSLGVPLAPARVHLLSLAFLFDRLGMSPLSACVKRTCA